MDDNMSDSDTDNKDGCDNNLTNRNKNSKRIKIQSSPSEEGTSNNSISGVELSNTASTSNENTSSGRTRSKNYRNRNHSSSNNREDSSVNESDEDDVEIGEANEDNGISLDEYSTSPASTSTVIHEADTDSENEEPQVLKKTKPKHTWYVVPEVLKRQIGYSSKLHTAELFRNQCYGSLHCVQRLELMYKLEEHYGCVNSLNFYPDGSLLASGSDDLYVVIWDWKVGKCLFKYQTKHRMNVFQTKFLHLNGDLHLATCSRDGQVRLARLSTEGVVKENRKLGSHKAACHKLSVLPDQPHIILSAGEDGVVLSHDIRKTKSDHILDLKVDNKTIPLYSIHGHPLKTHEFCIGGQNDTVRVYDQRKTTSTLATYHPFKKSETNHFRGLHVTSAMYSYDGREILASYNDADIYLFDAEAQTFGEYMHKYEGHRNGATIKGVGFFGPKSEFIVSGSDCGNIFFWEKNTEAIVQCMLGDDSGVVNCLEPHPRLPYICTSGLDWDVKVWVPSCETEPNLEKLPQIIKKNKKSQNTLGLAADAPVLWMLWQHLRRSSSSVRRELREMNFGSLDFGTSSGSDEDDEMLNESSNDDNNENEVEEDSDDDATIDFSSECTTS